MEPGSTLGPEGRYVVSRALGSGGMGDVYLALDRELGRQVALKVPRLRQGRSDPSWQRFWREAQLLARLRHPNLVDLYDVDLDSDPPYLVMEYLEGEDLGRRIEEGRTLPPDEGRAAFRALADALACIHRATVLHRDLKPANVFLQPGGRVRLMDLGLALASDGTRLTAPHQFAGTPLFSAPEVLAGAPATAASDVFQLGFTVRAALGGSWPYGRKPRLRDLLERPRELLAGPLEPNIPGDLAPVLAACCAAEPAARPKDGEALLALLAGKPPLRRAPRPPPPAPRPRRALGAGLSLVGLAALAALLHSAPTPARDLGAAVTELALTPDGAHLALGATAARAPEWRFEGRDVHRTGAFSRTGEGWTVRIRGLPPGSRGALAVVDGGRALGLRDVVLPEAPLATPATAAFGFSSLELRWALHGRAAVDVVVEPDGAPATRRREPGERCLVPLTGAKPGGRARWRLELDGAPLASGEGLLGPSVRGSVPRTDGDVTATFARLWAPPLVLGDRLVLALEAGRVACLRQEPGATPVTLVPAWTWRQVPSPAYAYVFGVLRGDPGQVLVLGTGGPGGVVVTTLDGATGREVGRLPLCVNAHAPRWCGLADGRVVVVCPETLSPAGVPEGRGSWHVLEPGGRRQLGAASLPGGTLELAGAGDRAVVARATLHGIEAESLHEQAGLLVRSAAELLEPLRGGEAPSLSVLELPDGAAVATRTGVHLLRGRGPGLERTTLALPPHLTEADARYGPSLLLPDGRMVFVTATDRSVARLGALRVQLMFVDPAGKGAITVRPVQAGLVDALKFAREWGLVARGKLLLLTASYQLVAFLDAPGLPLRANVNLGAPTRMTPAALGETLLLPTAFGAVYGMELIDP